MTVNSEIIKKCKTDYVRNDTQNLRYHSWHLCYRQFKQVFASNTKLINKDREELALILGFYLLSWGMGRNSKLMGKYNYRIHLGAINILFECKDLPKDKEEWADCEKDKYVNKILKLKESLTGHYKDYGKDEEQTTNENSVSPTDTLISKVILGTLGCVPAYDDYFRKGLRCENGKMEHTHTFNANSIEELWKFYKDNKTELEKLNEELRKVNQGSKFPEISYTPMKLVDIYFWTKGRSY